VGIIAGALGGALWVGLSGLALLYVVCASVLVTGMIQLVATGAALRAVSFFPVFGGQWWNPQIRAVLALMGPMILGLSAVQINSLVDYVIAYLFITVDGQRVGPAVLGYAQFLYQLPLGVFGISIATAIFPELSRKCAQKDRLGMAEVFERGIRLSLFISLPASVGLMYVARPLVAALYERGEFDAADTRRVAWTLFFYSIGTAAYFTQHIVIRAFYALHNSRTPANTALCMVVLNFLMNITLVFVMEERGLALATAVCAIIQVVYLSRRLSRDVPEIQWGRIARGVSGMLTATGIMAVILTLAMWPALGGRLIPSPPPVRLVALVVLGAGAYALSSRILRVEELTAALRGGRNLDLAAE
jgi:putative peptidoglycan lipid II flippase